MSDPAPPPPADGVPPQKPPRKKPGPPKGTRIGGRAKGTPNKRKREKELALQLELERLRAIEAKMKEGAPPAAAVAATSGKRLAKDVLRDFMETYAGMAAVHQPLPVGLTVPPGRQPNEDKFDRYAGLAVDAAKALAPFESPRYSAVMVGATQVTKVVVEGGMPNEFTGPGGEYLDLKALDVVTAEEEPVPALPTPPAKVANA